jgi:hypothetical protein
MIGRRLLGALFGVVALLTISACQWFPIPVGGGGGGSPCYVGTFTLSGEQIAKAVSSLGIPVTVTAVPGGNVTFTTTAAGQWSLTANQSFMVSAGQVLNGTAAVNATASGTYTATSSTITFTLTSLSGQASFNGTVFGQPVNQTVSLPTIGVDELFGLSGTASYTCGSTGPVLTFPNFTEDF